MTDSADITLDSDVLLRTGLIEADSAFAAAPEAPPAVDPEAFKAAMRVLSVRVALHNRSRRTGGASA